MSKSRLELPPEPSPPDPGECCGGGCHYCVYDAYEQALADWRQQVERIRAQRAERSAKK